jgi:hypothetical protein
MKTTINFTELQWSQAGYLNYKDIYGHTTYKPSDQLEKTMASLYSRLSFRMGNKHELNRWIPAPPKIWYRKQILDFMNEPGNVLEDGKVKAVKAHKFIDNAEKSYVSKC